MVMHFTYLPSESKSLDRVKMNSLSKTLNLIQLWKMNMDHLKNRPYVNGVILREQGALRNPKEPLATIPDEL